jgi:adenosylhomocysteine nucleosidase
MTAAVPVETVAGRRVLFVMAARAEYGPALQSRITPLITGVGPVEAAVVTAAALATTPVDLVVSLGSAGSARLDHCGLYQATEVAYRDMDASVLGFPRGETPFLGLPARLPLPLRLPGIPEATLSTGANIVSGAAYGAIAQDMVDMETWAVARACMTRGRPLIALRGISDGQADLTGLHDWTAYLHLIDAKLAEAVDLIATELTAGRLTVP